MVNNLNYRETIEPNRLHLSSLFLYYLLYLYLLILLMAVLSISHRYARAHEMHLQWPAKISRYSVDEFVQTSFSKMDLRTHRLMQIKINLILLVFELSMEHK